MFCYYLYMIPIQYFIFHKSHGSVFNLPILFALGKETNTVYSTKLISPETRFRYILFPTITKLMHGCTVYLCGNTIVMITNKSE